MCSDQQVKYQISSLLLDYQVKQYTRLLLCLIVCEKRLMQLEI